LWPVSGRAARIAKAIPDKHVVIIGLETEGQELASTAFGRRQSWLDCSRPLTECPTDERAGPMDANAKEITILLGQAHADRSAQDRLYRLIESRFHAMAQRLMKRERSDHTLQATILMDDAFQRLLADENPNWANRKQFFCAAAKVMRRMLVDYARRRAAQKRGSGEADLPLDHQPDLEARQTTDPQKLVELNELVERLELQHPESFKIFDLHYFMGYELKEIAEEILDVPYSTIKRRWAMAKAFLHRELFESA
jgi:RNA polymerase sigma-70 factor, ECF subfamily